jgi:Zn-finger nucleic acid-binding protein
MATSLAAERSNSSTIYWDLPQMNNHAMSLHCPNCGASVAADWVSCEYCQAALTMTACPSCFGAVFKGMKFCPNCGSAVERSEIRSDKQLTCPRCEQILASVDIAGTRIEECSSCGGIWLDTMSFQKICDNKEQQEKVMIYPSPDISDEVKPSPVPKRFYIPCPECGELMNQKNFSGCSGIVVDVCKPHGLWFDRQELQRIANFINDGGLHKAREKELENLKAEQNRLREMQYGPSLEPINVNERTSFFNSCEDRSLIDVLLSIGKIFF